ncbi:hypothetical protein KBY71_09170 [Cyanobium sp. T1B-Tous]|uniref:hypothetical protein n=1 Tax=Cyanobium sp. T1B-Tous TaxID=2823721 RepID=UPI0020CE97E3|nr:hypothetical protein [Cyanobium sp. T1B-Tous]MCP9806683.1 hypothetical protein [Cyanobium sp. T1B-Tous]
MTLKITLRAKAQRVYQSRLPCLGIGLAELLIVSAVGSLTAIILAQVYSGFVRERARLEMYQKAVNDWERLNRMIETDVSESRRVVLPGVVSCGGATSSFDLWVNELGNSAAASYDVISYSLNGGNLYRCGPPVVANGQLDLAAVGSSEALVGIGISFSSGTPGLATDGSLAYGFIFSGLSGARIVEFSSQARPSAQWIEQCAFASSSSC